MYYGNRGSRPDQTRPLHSAGSGLFESCLIRSTAVEFTTFGLVNGHFVFPIARQAKGTAFEPGDACPRAPFHRARKCRSAGSDPQDAMLGGACPWRVHPALCHAATQDGHRDRLDKSSRAGTIVAGSGMAAISSAIVLAMVV